MSAAVAPDLAAAMFLVDQLKAAGWRLERIAPGEDAPLVGKREGVDYVGWLWLDGFYRRCTARRFKRYSLVVPGGMPCTDHFSGDAITVLLKAAEWDD